MNKDTVAIIGSHPRTRNEYDFTRTDTDVWVFNEAISNSTFTHADAVFQMHEEAIWRNPENRNDPKHYDWLTTQTDTPVYMQEQYADVPASVRYPLEEIISTFKVKYFTSSIAYALALACYERYKRIELYGVEMETNTEYQYQRDGVTLWLGVALGLGIEVDAHISILDQPLYGYEGEVVFPYEKFQQRIEELMPQVEPLTQQYNGQALDLKKAVELFVADASKENEDRLRGMIGAQAELGTRLGLLDGGVQENERYQKKADSMREASGGEFLFSRQEFESAAKLWSDKANASRQNIIAVDTKLAASSEDVRKAAKGSPKRLRLGEKFLAEVKMYLQENNRTAVFQGMANENFLIMQWMDKHIRAAGGSKSEAVLLERMKANV